MKQDLFGHAFQRFLVDHDDTPIEVYINGEKQDPLPPSYFFRDFNAMPSLEQIALQRCRGKVLDVGAAAGCHSIWLQEKAGLEVVSLEQSKGACQVMQKRQLNHVVHAEFSTWQPDTSFDTILFMMNGLGMGQTIEGFINLLRHAKSMLAPDGEILGDTSDIVYMFDHPERIKKGRQKTAFEDHYYGLVNFELAYQEFREKFRWLYPDPQLVVECAREAGLDATCIQSGSHYDYLFSFRH